MVTTVTVTIWGPASVCEAQMYIPMTTCLVDYLFSRFDALIWALYQMRACVFFQMYSFLHTFATRNYKSL